MTLVEKYCFLTIYKRNCLLKTNFSTTSINRKNLRKTKKLCRQFLHISYSIIEWLKHLILNFFSFFFNNAATAFLTTAVTQSPYEVEIFLLSIKQAEQLHLPLLINKTFPRNYFSSTFNFFLVRMRSALPFFFSLIHSNRTTSWINICLCFI